MLLEPAKIHDRTTYLPGIHSCTRLHRRIILECDDRIRSLCTTSGDEQSKKVISSSPTRPSVPSIWSSRWITKTIGFPWPAWKTPRLVWKLPRTVTAGRNSSDGARGRNKELQRHDIQTSRRRVHSKRSGLNSVPSERKNPPVLVLSVDFL